MCMWEGSIIEHRGFQNFHDHAEYELKAKTNKQIEQRSIQKIHIQEYKYSQQGSSNKENSKTRTKNIRESKNTQGWESMMKRERGKEEKTHKKKHKAENTSPIDPGLRSSGPPQGKEN